VDDHYDALAVVLDAEAAEAERMRRSLAAPVAPARRRGHTGRRRHKPSS
jgi:hypothetical protein